MLILLPPSEGKTQPSTGRPVDLESLSFPELTPARAQVARALIEVCGSGDALGVLKVPPSLGELVAANTDVLCRPSAAAWKVYDGVLFDALGYQDLDTAARRRAARQVVVSSALWGAVRLTDRIPAYRLSMSVTLPRLGALARYWRAVLDAPLSRAASRGLIIDCRSSTYAAAWRPAGALVDRHVPVRVLREHAGTRTVVSHMAKHARGLVARALLQQASAPRSVDELVVMLNAHFDGHDVHTATGDRVEVRVEASYGGSPGLDVVTT